MKKHGGARKGAGAPRGKRPKPKANPDESTAMTLREVADYLHCHYGTAYKLARRGEIPGFRLGGSWRFLKSEVDKWTAKGGAPAKTDGRGRKPKPKA